jgi:multiple sugar transport system substrate-binding protein
MRIHAVVLAAVLTAAPLGARGADLVVWWEQGFSPQEDEAVAEIIAAFEHKTGKQVELVQPTQNEMVDQAPASVDAGEPPDFLFGTFIVNYISEWAFNDLLVDLTDSVGIFSDIFDPDALAEWMLLNQKTGQRALYALPMGRTTNHVHVWKSLLEEAGFTLEDIPKEWEAFWAFWCDEVQPAVRRVTGRDDIWAVGLNMSGKAGDTQYQFFQFLGIYEADYVARDGRLIIDDPGVRGKLIKAIDAYTGIHRKGCTPPGSITWNSNLDNNRQFLAQAVVTVLNDTLSIPNVLKRERPDDYYKSSATIEWPLGPNGEAFPIQGDFFAAAVFKGGGNVETAKEFVRFLVGEGWLAHYLDFSGERMLPPMPKLLDAPFWLDPSDPHRMAAVMQIASRPLSHEYGPASGDLRHDRILQELVWAKAIHRVAADGISPEQAVDEAIARIKQILSE